MNNQLHIQIKTVFGKEMIYPANDQARRLCEMVGSKTLTPQIIRDACTMGFVMVEVGRQGQADDWRSLPFVARPSPAQVLGLVKA